MVIHHHSQIVGRVAVRAQQDQVIQPAVLEPHVALHRIRHNRVAVQRALQTYRIGSVGPGRRVRIPPGRTNDAALGAGAFTLDLQVLRRHVVTIGLATGLKFGDYLAVAICAGKLEHRRLVGLHAQPRKTIENHLDRSVRRPLAISVFHAQQELATRMARIKPVEQCGPSRANVHHAGRGWGNPGADRTIGHRTRRGWGRRGSRRGPAS